MKTGERGIAIVQPPSPQFPAIELKFVVSRGDGVGDGDGEDGGDGDGEEIDCYSPERYHASVHYGLRMWPSSAVMAAHIWEHCHRFKGIGCGCVAVDVWLWLFVNLHLLCAQTLIYLHKHAHTNTPTQTHSNRHTLACVGCHSIELGAGMGLPSIAAASCGAEHVIITDLADSPNVCYEKGE